MSHFIAKSQNLINNKSILITVWSLRKKIQQKRKEKEIYFKDGVIDQNSSGQ